VRADATGVSGEIILYTTEDGGTQVSLREIDGNVWLTQLQLADLFQTSVPNINQHIKGIIEEGEQPEATIKSHLIVQTEGARSVERQVAHYNLPMILAIGFRVGERAEGSAEGEARCGLKAERALRNRVVSIADEISPA
jgi:hypothetical protein